MTLIGIMVVLLYASRACYNLVVLALADIENINSFDYDWYNVSDQVGLLFYAHITVTSFKCNLVHRCTTTLWPPPGGPAVIPR